MWIVFIGLLSAAIIGLVLWRRKRARTRLGPLPQQVSSEPFPESRFVEVDGVKIHFTQMGSGPDVVLLHGIGASVYVWRLLLPLLRTRVRVTAIDLPGFGKSSKDATRDYGLDMQSRTVSQTLNAIGITNAVLVGSSMGGAIALWMAKHEPHRFSRVIAIGPATDHRLVPAFAVSFGALAPLLWRALNRNSMRLILSRVVRRRELITDECVDRYLEPFRDSADSLKTFWAALSLLADKRLPNHLAGLQADVLVLYGEYDEMVPRRSIEKLLKAVPHAKFELHPHGGHHVMEDDPEWTAQHILSFIGIADHDEPKIQSNL